jgi:hypothetical protein
MNSCFLYVNPLADPPPWEPEPDSELEMWWEVDVSDFDELEFPAYKPQCFLE